MKRDIPVEKNEDYIIDIKSMGFEGEGVGKVNDFTVFIPEAIIGETVKVKIIKINKNFAFGKLIDIIKPSEYREVEKCSINKKCGGCQLQHLSYEGQLNFKKLRVEDCITRIGKLKDVIIHPTIGMKNPYRYRNKVQLPVRKVNGEIKIGFYAKRSHDIIDMNSCSIQEESADKVISITREWINKYNIEPYNEETQRGAIRHIMIRKAFRTGEVMIVLVSNEREIPYIKEFIDIATSNITGVVSIIQNMNTKSTNVILGEENEVLWGKDTITDYIGKFKFSISPLSFFQVNPVQTEILYSKALEYAGLNGKETVFDAYCGTGTISLFLSEKANKVYGVEVVQQAIDNAMQNAKDNNITNAEFVVGESEKVIPELIRDGIKPNVIVVDPPRKGCDRELLEAIAEVKPERIVYVSCDPGTLARDLGILDELGFRTLEVQPVDMFPQTTHVECVVLIEKK